MGSNVLHVATNNSTPCFQIDGKETHNIDKKQD